MESAFLTKCRDGHEMPLGFFSTKRLALKDFLLTLQHIWDMPPLFPGTNDTQKQIIIYEKKTFDDGCGDSVVSSKCVCPRQHL
jgi:hypothetical protein